MQGSDTRRTIVNASPARGSLGWKRKGPGENRFRPWTEPVGMNHSCVTTTLNGKTKLWVDIMIVSSINLKRSHVPCSDTHKMAVSFQRESSEGCAGLRRPAGILMPFEFDALGHRLLTRAVHLSNGLNATLRLLHVMDDGPADLRTRHLCERKMHEWVHRDGLLQVPVHIQVRQGNRLDQLLRAMENIPTDLVVMSASREGHTLGPCSRNLAEQLTRWAPVPVLTYTDAVLDDKHHVCGEYPCAHWKRILVPVDMSAASTRALNYAVALAQEHKAELLVLHASMVPTSVFEAARTAKHAVDAHQFVPYTHDRLMDWASRVVRGRCSWTSQVRAGVSVAPAILIEAKRFRSDLIVLGTGKPFFSRHRRWMSGMDVILRYACCQVLTIPNTTMSCSCNRL